MNVLIPTYIPSSEDEIRSGVDRYLFELTQGLQSEPEICVKSLPRELDQERVLESKGTDEVRSEVSRKRMRLPATVALVLGTLREIITLTRVYRKWGDKKHAVFHAQRVGCEYQTIAARLAGFRHIISTVHNLPGEDSHAMHPFKRAIERLSFGCASHHICVSAATFDEWHTRMGLKRSKCTIIYNGMTPPDYSAFDRAQYRSALGLAVDEVVIGICARLHPMKGHTVLFAAYRLLLASLADNMSKSRVRLLIAGDGPEEQMLKAVCDEYSLNDSILFLGHRSDSRLIIAACDINVLPSVSLECTPYSLVEAMFAGLPSVVSDVGGMKELVQASRGGVVVEKGNASLLAERLREYVESADLRKEHGAAARKYAETHLDANNMVKQTIHVYEDALAG